MAAQEPWKEFEPRRENLIKMLHTAQQTNGETSSISDESLGRIAEYVGVSFAEAAGVATFYQAFSRRPRGRHVVRVCDSLSCRVRGSLEVYARLRTRLGIGRGETTPDGEFTLEIVNCLGSCDTAPNIMIDDRLYEHVTPEIVDTILDAVRTQKEKVS
jgi:NADH:ubiquinone oxidoreductase subunit E